ncbi:MAG: valine--tRNA ligase [Candidatus Moraniibacteriota bacterium]
MKELPKIYEPQKFENEIYARWEQGGFFQPEIDQSWADSPDNSNSAEIQLPKRQTYCNILPPPNANGELHIGHASGYTVMDIFGRYARMNGKKTLLLPGKDHAGIQTQVVFEKKLKAESGISRQELGREKFYEKTYEFCLDRANYMRSQEKKIGISADWSREKFTLDPDVLSSALATFVKMHGDGLIYKGKRIINWCPRCATALSDVEVLHKDAAGKLYFIKYPLENSDQFITVATTRPETMLGDTAVAVNPKDERYQNLVGKNIILPLQNTIIPIIADHRIDLTFGTGAVKITPAHDPLDWEIGRDHNLAEIQVINEQARITELGGEYANLPVLEARQAVVADLERLGLLEKIEELAHSVSICERCKTTIEPLTSKQWFINVEQLKKQAIEAIEKNEIEIFPLNFKKILIDWFGNMRDWCISRQIWWGPQFPVWYCQKCGEEKYIVSLEKPAQCPHCNGTELTQDENTFDTWFTSGQWVHTTLQARSDDFKTFFPTDMMITGRDLLFFWASKMIMMSLYATGKVPFKNLFFTGLVLDKEGHKFSKSRGNGIDPLTMIDKFGADALRMSLIMDSAPGQDSRLYEEKIETFRNFANKLWNISRYCLTQENFKLVKEISEADLVSPADHWIAENLNEKIVEINKLFESKQIAVAADLLKSFTWDNFADHYLEWDKLGKNKKVLGYVLDKVLRLWHPFMPFITEHLWTLAEEKTPLIISSWPTKTTKNNPELASYFSQVITIISSLKNIRAEYKIENAIKLNVFLETDLQTSKFLLDSLVFIKKRASVNMPSFDLTKEIKENAVKRTLGNINLYVSLEGLLDVEKETAKAEKEIANLEKFVAGLSMRLSNQDFVAKAPAQIIAQQQETLAKKQAELAELKKHLQTLS